MKKKVKKVFDPVINRKGMKSYILKRAKFLRPGWKCTCVSHEALDKIEYKVKRLVDIMVESHPSIGKTFKEIL